MRVVEPHSLFFFFFFLYIFSCLKDEPKKSHKEGYSLQVWDKYTRIGESNEAGAGGGDKA